MKSINLAEKLSLFQTYWDPKVVANYNDNEIMVAKFKGEFPFHKHEDTDDFFLVLDGEIEMDREDGDPITVSAGEIFVVPAGVVHRPRAAEEAKLLLIQPKGSPNTGDADAAPSAKEHI